jgi:hypothetical protein
MTAEGDLNRVVELMAKIGPRSVPDMTDYRTWPVFRGLEQNENFLAAFASTFNQPFNVPKVTEVEMTKLDPTMSEAVQPASIR